MSRLQGVSVQQNEPCDSLSIRFEGSGGVKDEEEILIELVYVF